MFRGSMEQLRQIGGVGALARTHAVYAVGRDMQESTSAATSQPPAGAPREAVTAYAQTQKTQSQRHPLRRVEDVMSRPVTTLSDKATVLQAWQVLAQQGVGQAPVVNQSGQLVGLMLRADLLRLDRLPGPDSHAVMWRALMAQSVLDVMSSPVPSVSADTDLRRVARVLLDTGLPGLAVVDEQGQVTGFVARSDILRAVVTDPPLDLWG
jgi:CBS-domain-containing membrane protein